MFEYSKVALEVRLFDSNVDIYVTIYVDWYVTR